MANANVNQGLEDDNYLDEGEDVELLELEHNGHRVGLVGVSASGVVFLSGDLHVHGSADSLLVAAREQVPYISTSDGNVMFPADWLRNKCQFEPDRLQVIDKLERFVRSPIFG